MHGWFDLAFPLAKDCANIRGGLTAITDKILTEMDFPMHIELETIGPPLLLSLIFCHFMADAMALQQVLGVKTSGSHKPCLCCANIVGLFQP